MKRTVVVFCLVTLLSLLAVQPAHAQFWKNWFKKETPVRKPAPKTGINSTNVKKTITPPPKRKTSEPSKLKLAPSVARQRYRVDVLVPLYLNELVTGGKPVYKNHLPDKVLPGLHFYQGVRLAADTLNFYGYKLDVHIHDISDPTHSVDVLLKGNRLDSADLIIGAVQAQHVAPLASLARKRSINFVSALSPADANIKGNPYFNLLQPSLQRHCEVLRNAVSRKVKPTSNVLVYSRNSVSVDEQCFRYLTRDSTFAYSKVLVNSLLPVEKLRNFLDSNGENIIVMPILDVAYVKQLLEQLGKSFSKHRIEVYGMPSWKGMSLLQKEGSLPNIGITIGAPFYFDPTASAGRGLAEAYNRVYGGKPSEMAFRGYETLYWYAYLLKRYGTVFNDHFADNGAALFTRFDMKLSTDRDGAVEYYENNHVYLYRYQGGSFSVEQ